MAVCHGPDSPYGCNHHREHQIAARKGWRSRRRSRAFLQTGDAAALRTQVGDFEGHHTHRTKSGATRHLLKINGYWFSMPQHEYRSLVSAGHASLRAQRREETHRKRAEALEAIRAPKRAERERRQAERARAEEEKIARRVQRAEHSEVLRVIRANGGIKRNKGGYLHGEYEAIPKHARAHEAHGVERERGVTMDQAAELVGEHMPWLHIHTSDELTNYFDHVSDVKAARRAAPQRHEPAPAPAAAPAPAPEPAASWGDIFGEAQPIPHPEAPADLFGGNTDPSEMGKRHRGHKHVWEPWRNDWRYMRCKKCGALERSTFGSGVSL